MEQIIKITLETLYDLLRNEKKREDLQKLDPVFFFDVLHYLREKKALLAGRQQSTELFAAGERDKLEYELRSIKRILKELYEKREKKIMDIALNKSRTGSDIIDTSAMLSIERDFYNRLLKTLDDYRKGVLLNLFSGELPSVPEQRKLEAEEWKGASPSLSLSAPSPSLSLPAFEHSSVLSPRQPSAPEIPPLTRIKFIHPLPSFVWKDLKVYGPYDIGEEIEIYPEVAELIVRKGRAVKA